MTDITTPTPRSYQDGTDIIAETPAAALRLPAALLAGADKPALRETTDRLVRTLIAEPEATAASVIVPSGEVELAAGDAFGDTSLDALDEHLDALANAAIDVYWHVELGDDQPAHFQSPGDPFDDRELRADGSGTLTADATEPRDHGDTSVPDPATAHAEELLGRRVRVAFTTRVEIGEIRGVEDDIERGRDLRIRITTDTGTRNVVLDPTRHDLSVLPTGGDAA